MKLYTRTDLERVARLTTLHRLVDSDPEVAIARAVESVTAEAPPYYDEATVKLMLQYVTESEDVEQLFEEALSAIRQL